MNENWNNLITEKFINSSYNFENTIYAIKICDNDLNYLKENYNSYTNKSVINDYYFISCAFSKTIDLIQFIKDKFKLNINTIDNKKNNCLHYACAYNHNLEIIKYFIHDLKIDINYLNNFNSSCLHKACLYNTNLQIIKFLIEDIKMNINCVNLSGDNLLTAACWKNKNPEIIKYLIYNVRLNIEHIDVMNDNCFGAACNTENIIIVKYLIEDTIVTFNFKNISISFFKKIILIVNKNYQRLCDFIKYGLKTYDHNNIIETVKQLNPFILDECICKIFQIDSPYDVTFDIFVKNIDQLKVKVDLSVHVISTNTIKLNDKKNTICRDYSKNELLFEINGICYYGHRNIVYKSIQCFNELISEGFDLNENIVLKNSTPRYIVNLYIDACYNESFDINDIKPIDLISFLKFIDQYPSNSISIDILEQPLIQYIEKHNIVDEFLKNICLKYQFKKMYVYFHNQNIVT